MKRRLFWCVALLLLIAFQRCKKNAINRSIHIDFTASSLQLKAGDSIVFKDLSTGTVANWNWEFEGGLPETSELSGPTVVYSKPGVYNVTLKLGNAAGETVLTKEKMITVGYSHVHAAIGRHQEVVLQNETIVFKDSSAGLPTKWTWEFEQVASGKKRTSSDQHPQMSFADSGYYNLRLIAANPDFSDTLVRQQAFYIADPRVLVAGFAADTLSLYEGQSVRLHDKTIGIATGWDWILQSGSTVVTGTGKDPVIKMDKAGIYTVALTAKNNITTHTKTVAKYLKVIPADGLAGYFPFDRSFKDHGPLTMDISERGKLSFIETSRSGASATAGTFNGSTGLIVADNGDFNFGKDNFTVSVWLQSSSIVRMMLWQESGKNGTRDNQAWVRLNSSETQYIALNTEDKDGGSSLSIGSTGNITNGKWTHLVAVRSGETLRIYVNAVLLGERTITTGVREASNSGNFKIGMQEGTGGFNNYFIGNLDDLIIYKRALSESEVNELYNY